MAPLVLASRSPYRAKILMDAGIAHEVVPADIDESVFQQPDPADRAVAIALGKARFIERPGFVLGVDQVVFDPHTGEIFGKPRDPDDHVRRLLSMRGRYHDLVTGFALCGAGEERIGAERTRIWVRDVTEAEVRSYVASGEAAGCAGGYAAEGRGGFLIDRVEGDWFNVIGLPLYRVWSELRALGWRFDESR